MIGGSPDKRSTTKPNPVLLYTITGSITLIWSGRRQLRKSITLSMVPTATRVVLSAPRYVNRFLFLFSVWDSSWDIKTIVQPNHAKRFIYRMFELRSREPTRCQPQDNKGRQTCTLGLSKTGLKKEWKGKEVFYLTTHSTHFIYGYMASDIWLRTILIVRKETRCRHFFRLTAMVLLYAPSHIQDSTYHGLCYTSRGALAGLRLKKEWMNIKRHLSMKTDRLLGVRTRYMHEMVIKLKNLNRIQNLLKQIKINSGWREIVWIKEGRKMFYLTRPSTLFIYGYIASDIW